MSDRPLTIDFHAHILPRADHGSRNTRESLNQLAIMNRCGVDMVVATPHFYPHASRVSSFLERVDSAAEKLAAHKTETPEIFLGAEVLYCEGLDRMEGLEALCIRGTRVLLLELPLSEWNTDILYTVERLTKHFTVVLAHVDRYIKKQSDDIISMLQGGAYAQVNAISLQKASLRKKLLPLFASDRVVALGSDLHETEEKSCRALVFAQKKLGSVYDDIMARSRMLLQNAEPLSQQVKE